MTKKVLLAVFLTFALILEPTFVRSQAVVQAQKAPAIYVANPGENFGPVKLGTFAPSSGPQINCLSTYRGRTDMSMLKTTIYYLDSGLESNQLNDGKYIYSVSFTIRGYDHTAQPSDYYRVVDPALYDRGCVTTEGKGVLTTPTKVYVPKNVIWVTNKGVQLGMTIEDVLARHGAPECSTTHPSTTFLTYDGLSFALYNGRVGSISVSTYRPSDNVSAGLPKCY